VLDEAAEQGVGAAADSTGLEAVLGESGLDLLDDFLFAGEDDAGGVLGIVGEGVAFGALELRAEGGAGARAMKGTGCPSS